MDACEGFIVINGPAAALVGAGATALFGFIGYAIKEALKGRDNHIAYAQDVNADLTQNNRDAIGVAGISARKAVTGRRTGTHP